MIIIDKARKKESKMSNQKNGERTMKTMDLHEILKKIIPKTKLNIKK